MTERKEPNRRRLNGNAGIAIGPILFIIAILAVLVGALAAGDSGFSTSITSESNRVNATSIIQQGNNLQSAIDRVLANGTGVSSIYVDPNVQGMSATLQQSALFSTAGGGMLFPFPPDSATPPGSSWAFVPNATLVGVGTGTGEYIAVLPITSAAMCLALNSVIFGQSSAAATTVPAASAASFTTVPVTASSSTGTVAPASNSFDDTGASAMTGAPQGCISNAGGSAWYYYQLLIAN